MRNFPAGFVMVAAFSLQVLAQQPPAPPAAPPAPAPAARPPAPPPAIAPSIAPTYTVDLTTAEGAALFGAHWKTSDVKIVEVPGIPANAATWKTTYDIEPKANEATFDDSAWPTIEAKDVKVSRGGGHVSMRWYRTTLTIPDKVGPIETTGARVVLALTVDDYGEIWVNGQMPRAVGRPSPGTVQGFNMPNRVVLSESVKAGDKFQVAVFGINGPISASPANGIFVRDALIQIFR